MRDRIKHAFSVGDGGATEPTPEQQPAVDWLCHQVTKRHLSTPGLIVLEMSRPLNYLGAQVMHFFEPVIWTIARQANHEHFKHLASFLEHRGSIEYLCRRIEALEEEFERNKKTRRESEAPDVPETD